MKQRRSSLSSTLASALTLFPSRRRSSTASSSSSQVSESKENSSSFNSLKPAQPKLAEQVFCEATSVACAVSLELIQPRPQDAEKPNLNITQALMIKADLAEHVARPLPSKEMPTCMRTMINLLSSSSPLVNDFFESCYAVQLIIDKSVYDERGRVSVCFGNGFLDTSIVPPPCKADCRAAQELCEAMLKARSLALLVQDSPLALDAARVAYAKLVDIGAPRFDNFAALLEKLSSGVTPFDQELGDRISSLIRFHLREALNPVDNFARIILGGPRIERESTVPLEAAPETMAVSSILHRALWILHDYTELDASLDQMVQYKGAQTFVLALIRAMDELTKVDAYRGTHWRLASEWARRCIGSQWELDALALLKDLTALTQVCNARAGESQLARVLAQRPRIPGPGLRAMRADRRNTIVKFPSVQWA